MKLINITEKLRKLLEVEAREIARKYKHRETVPLHLLAAILRDSTNEVNSLLSLKEREELKKEIHEKFLLMERDENIVLSKFSTKLLDLVSKLNSKSLKEQDYISTREIFYQILKEEKLLKKFKINKAKIFKNKIKILDKNVANNFFYEEAFYADFLNSNLELSKYCKNLSELANEGKLEKLVGREEEITILINILSRKSKNSAILLGDPGVGKTAIVEGIAQKIAKKDVPTFLKNKTIFSLEVSSLIAGTKYRGEFEERINNIMKSLKFNKDIIIFIDEIHTLIGAGNSEGTLDASNIIKPALSKSEIQIIGATTHDEYRRHIEKDKAFTRRFQTIQVNEPSEDETFKIIDGIKEKFEKHHKVTYTNEAIWEAIKLAKEFLPNKKFPDKVIDIIDIAGASLKIKGSAKREVEREEIKATLEQMLDLNREKFREREEDERVKLKEVLENNLIAQDLAVEKVMREIVRIKISPSSSEKTLLSLLFIGTSSVGKTLMSQNITLALYSNSNYLFKIDMRDYRDENSLSRLIGTGPGYVGYSDGGLLLNRIKSMPHTVLLLKNIEQAHSAIINLISQILENGEIRDNKNNTVSFKNVVLIMTTKLGSKELLGEVKLGFKNEKNLKDEREKNIERELKKHFKDNFLNQIKSKVIFNVLENENIKVIFKKYLENLKLKYKNISLNVSDDVLSFIIEKYYKREEGLKSLEETIKVHIEDKIIDEFLKRDAKENNIEITLNEKTINSLKS